MFFFFFFFFFFGERRRFFYLSSVFFDVHSFEGGSTRLSVCSRTSCSRNGRKPPPEPACSPARALSHQKCTACGPAGSSSISKATGVPTGRLRCWACWAVRRRQRRPRWTSIQLASGRTL